MPTDEWYAAQNDLEHEQALVTGRLWLAGVDPQDIIGTRVTMSNQVAGRVVDAQREDGCLTLTLELDEVPRALADEVIRHLSLQARTPGIGVES